MSDYPMLISNKLHSFRNFSVQKYKKSRNVFVPAPQFMKRFWVIISY